MNLKSSMKNIFKILLIPSCLVIFSLFWFQSHNTALSLKNQSSLNDFFEKNHWYISGSLDLSNDYFEQILISDYLLDFKANIYMIDQSLTVIAELFLDHLEFKKIKFTAVLGANDVYYNVLENDFLNLSKTDLLTLGWKYLDFADLDSSKLVNKKVEQLLNFDPLSLFRESVDKRDILLNPTVLKSLALENLDLDRSELSTKSQLSFSNDFLNLDLLTRNFGGTRLVDKPKTFVNIKDLLE